MIKHLKYLKYVIRHKWYVFIECCKLGIPWRGIVHDMSKLKPAEWLPYVNHFYGDKPSPRDKTGAYNPLLVRGDFDYAWLSHQHNNPHHWQYWILRGDAGWTKVMPMPDKYIREMVADWQGAGKAITGKNDATDWYKANKSKMELHQTTITRVEELLGIK